MVAGSGPYRQNLTFQPISSIVFDKYTDMQRPTLSNLVVDGNPVIVKLVKETFVCEVKV
jgi:hypothetical protein